MLPDVDIQDQIAHFLNSYPFLRQDQSYVTFLEYYAGASIVRADNELCIDIYGFLENSTHILDYEDPIVDEEGFLTFALVILHDTHHIGFGFDATQKRPWGIYRAIVDGSDVPYRWYCDTFLEWLARCVQMEGHLLEPW